MFTNLLKYIKLAYLAYRYYKLRDTMMSPDFHISDHPVHMARLDRAREAFINYELKLRYNF